MKAMIFSAGKGTRLRPVTRNIPKALVEVGQRTMLERSVTHCKTYGFHDIIINVHHFSEKIKEYLRNHNHFNLNITVSDESHQLLDTGGGLKQALWFFTNNEPFLVRNVDVLSNLNLRRLYEFHLSQQALVTLVVRERPSSRYLLFDRENTLCGWENTKTKEIKLVRQAEKYKKLAFSGIQIADRGISEYMPDDDVFSIMTTYLEAGKEKKIKAYIDRDSMWFDIGNLENLEKARTIISKNEGNAD